MSEGPSMLIAIQDKVTLGTLDWNTGYQEPIVHSEVWWMLYEQLRLSGPLAEQNLKGAIMQEVGR